MVGLGTVINVLCICGAVGVMVSNDTIGLTDTVSTPSFSSSGILLIISLIVYALSWGLPIFFYKNREIYSTT